MEIKMQIPSYSIDGGRVPLSDNKEVKYVYLLEHYYQYNGHEDAKLIGIYSSEEKAKEVIGKYKLLPGFKDFPNDFIIDKYEINKDEWTEGFISPIPEE